MLSRGVLAIGLLVCANITNAYILFSANIEDIKKVASKFLSSDVVEELTSLISKFKTDAKNNLSLENTVNEKSINKVSDDDIEERAPTYKQPHTISKETERDRYDLVSANKDEMHRYKFASINKDETERDRHRLASMNRDESGRDTLRLRYMNKDKTERDRHRFASMNKDETERDSYKHVSMNIVSQEDKSYKNVINQVKDDIDRGMLQTTHGLRERKIDRQEERNRKLEERERKFKKGRVRDDLYWNDEKVDGLQSDRVVATSGRIKLPYGGKREYNWEISSDN